MSYYPVPKEMVLDDAAVVKIGGITFGVILTSDLYTASETVQCGNVLRLTERWLDTIEEEYDLIRKWEAMGRKYA